MFKFTQRVTGASLLSLLLASAAQAAPGWNFNILAQGFNQSNTPSTFFALDLSAMSPSPMPPDPGLTGSVTTPDGLSTGSFTPYSGSSTQEFYSSFSNFQSIAATGGPWSLTATDNNVTSTYQFSPDFSGIDSTTIPQITISSPLLSSTTSNPQPTFTWSDSGDINDLQIQFTNQDLSINYIEQLPLTQTNWTVPAALPPGLYTITAQVTSASQDIPLSSTLLTGPDLGLPSTASFYYDAIDQENITIVPEPTGLALALAIPLLLRRRNRSMA
jgi:hypothetical protein